MVEGLRPAHKLCDLLYAFKLAKSSYLYQKRALTRSDKYAEVRKRICEIFEKSGECYGYRRSKKGCSADNAAMEGFFGRLKAEFFYGRSWQGYSIKEFIQELDRYITWYNESRIKLSLGGKSQKQYREQLGIMV